MSSFYNSKAIFEQAVLFMPGGVNSPVRAFKSVNNPPIIVKKAGGSKIYDVDNNEYIDYVMSYGPMILGHADKRVVNAIKESAGNGFSYGATTEKEIELARLIVKYFPSVEMIRLVNSGTEAVMSALRLARGFTGKDKVIKFEGCYHGHSDSMLVKAGSGSLTTSVPSSAGIPLNLSKDTFVADYNDINSVKSIFLNNKNEIAAVIIEPIAANMGVVVPEYNFLKELIAVTHENNALIIFDEVITGFRVSKGGAQGLYKLAPDLTCLGKIIGGGLPIGAFGGKKNIMSYLSPEGPVYQAGTLSGNPVCVSAGIATIKAVEDDNALDKANSMTEYLVSSLEEQLKKYNDKITINSISSLFTVFFKKPPVTCFKDVIGSDLKTFKKFFGLILKEGIFAPPSQYEALFISSAHSKGDIDKTAAAFKKAFKEIFE